MQYADEHKYEYCTIGYAFSKSNYLYIIWLYKDYGYFCVQVLYSCFLL